MDISQWLITFQVTSESELVINSLNPNVNSILFTAYILVSVLIKRAVFIAAFFLSCFIFDSAIFDPLSEASLYLITFAIYSYVIFDIACNRKAVFACGTIIILSITLAYDAYFYGIDGVYGSSETFIYNNIEYLALYSHLILIGALIPYRRIRDGFGRFIDSILLISRNSAYFTPI